MSACLIFTSITLLILEVPYGLKFFAWTISGVGYAGQATNFVWCNLAVRDDDQERAVVLASMNMWSNVLTAWFPLVFFPSSSAPKFHRGWIALIVVAILTVLVAVVTKILDDRDHKSRSKEQEQDCPDIAAEISTANMDEKGLRRHTNSHERGQASSATPG